MRRTKIYEPWAKKVLKYLQARGIGPGAIINIAYPSEDLLVYNPPDSQAEDGMFTELMCNQLGIEEEVPTRFFVEAIDVFSEDMVLLKLVGGTCLQDVYYYSIDGFEHILNFKEAEKRLNQIDIIQSSSFDHTHPTW